MDRHGITALVGTQCIFSTLHEALTDAHVTPMASVEDL
jgi:hypothetical protein